MFFSFVSTISQSTLPFRMRVETLRAATFKYPVNPLDEHPTWAPWTNHHTFSPRTLAQNGFYYSGFNQVVRCAYCTQQFDVSTWNADVSISDEHHKISPLCPFLTNLAPPYNVTKEFEAERTERSKHVFECGLKFTTDTTVLQHQDLLRMNIYMRNMFSNPRMIRAAQRAETFHRGYAGPASNINSLVDAGFYFIGPENCVTCYMCGVFTKSILSQYDPFEIHLYFNPTCAHIPLVRGPVFVDQFKTKIAIRTTEILNTSVVGANDVYVVGRTVSNALLRNFEDEKHHDNVICHICNSRPANIIIFPCNHVTTCGACTSNFIRCPIPHCKNTITAFTWSRIIDS